MNTENNKKCKWTAPNGQQYDCKPSPLCGDCENNKFNYYCAKKGAYCSKRNCYECEHFEKKASEEEINKARELNPPMGINYEKPVEINKEIIEDNYALINERDELLKRVMGLCDALIKVVGMLEDKEND
jgi:hypothetical protein